MKLLINDANILIDIVKLDLVEAFLQLEFEMHTTDFVFSELEERQQNFFLNEKLNIITTEKTEDYTQIFKLQSLHKGLSFEDCSVWHYAKQLKGILITGDGKLRKNASHAGIVVKGIIYIIEEIKIQNLLSIEDCIEKLKELKKLNNRLPHNEIDKRVQIWGDELTLDI